MANGEALGVINGNGKYSKLVLGPSTLVPIGAAAGVVITLITGTIYLERKFNSIERQMDNMQLVLNAQLRDIRMSMASRWTAHDMKVWTQELKIKNPTLEVPDSASVVATRDKTALDTPIL